MQAGKGSLSKKQTTLSAHSTLPSKETKYKNEKVFLYEDGYAGGANLSFHGNVIAVFDSKKEYARYNELLFLNKQNIISNLSCQHELLIQEGFLYQDEKVQKITYRADFAYHFNGKFVVEDVKPFDVKTQTYRLTEAFKLKWKLLKKRYPDIDFRLV